MLEGICPMQTPSAAERRAHEEQYLAVCLTELRGLLSKPLFLSMQMCAGYDR